MVYLALDERINFSIFRGKIMTKGPVKYRHILLAVDLHPNCDKTTVERAVTIANDFGAKLSMVYGVEHISVYGIAQAYPTVLDLEEQIVSDAKEVLAKLGEKCGISLENQYVEVGPPKSIILAKAAELQVDLIVMGSHGRHGLGLLLGSTANAVLHHATCDVLAVRVKE